MRAILVLIVVILLLALVGWIRFIDTPQQSTISIEKETIKQDTGRMVERGNEFVNQTRRAVGTETAPAATPPSVVEQSPPTSEGTPIAPPVQTEQPAAVPPTTTVR